MGDDIFSLDDYMKDMDSDGYSDSGGSESNMFGDGGDMDLDDLLASMNNDVGEIREGQPKKEKIKTEKVKKEKIRKEKIKKEKKKHTNIFRLIFGNIQDERTVEEKEKLKKKVIDEYEAKEKAKLDKEAQREIDAKAREERKKLEEEEAKTAKETKLIQKQEKQSKAKEAKAAKKDEKLKKQREIQELIDQAFDDSGKINKVGTTIVFAFFIALAVLIIIGTNILTYNSAIDSANNYYNGKYYMDALEAVYGIKLKDEDLPLYDKLITINYVNKQLDSYNNYTHLGKYELALDSLIKGLILYDKYYTSSKVLKVEMDLDYIRDRLLHELENVFNVDEDMANGMMLSFNNDRLGYSDSVRQIASAYEPR